MHLMGAGTKGGTFEVAKEGRHRKKVGCGELGCWARWGVGMNEWPSGMQA
jgi:hypothetical protein